MGKSQSLIGGVIGLVVGAMLLGVAVAGVTFCEACWIGLLGCVANFFASAAFICFFEYFYPPENEVALYGS